jgi:hypothetical protein
MRHLYWPVLLAALAAGCSDNRSKDVMVPIDQVPAPLVKVARDTLPDITFDHARKKENGVYEIRGKNKQGKVREVEVSPSGEVLEIE